MAEPSDVSRTSFDHRAVQQAGADSVRQGTGPGKAREKRRTTQLGDGGEIALAAVAPPLRRHYPGSDDYQIAAAHRPMRHLSRLLWPTRSPRIGELRISLSRKFRRIGGDTRMAGSYSPPVGWTGVNSTLLPGKDGPPIALPTALQRCTVMPPTGSSRIVAALASSSVGTPHGPVTLDGEAGRGSWRRASGSSGRDALMPPRLEDGLWDGRVPGDRGRSGGQAPARAHPAAGAPAGGGWGPGTWERLPGATEPRPPSR
jgi:hypothetical protein